MKKQVILLNGPSSSGKSTLSRALQALIEERLGKRYAIVSIDDFMKLATDETIYEDDVFEISGDMCESALSLLQSSCGVIIDHVITSERIFEQLINALEEYHIFAVHVSCPLQVLCEREQARGNRCLGSAEASYTYLFPKEGYDVVVDTYAMTPSECAFEIFEALI